MDKQAIIRDILSQLPLNSNHSESEWDLFVKDILSFVRAVDWAQPWLIGLLLFHVVSFVFVIISRKKYDALGILLGLFLVLATLSEPLNTFASRNWHRFASANTFDESGLFASTVYSFPLLLNALIVIVLILRITVKKLVEVKRIQLAQARRKPINVELKRK